MKYIIVEGNPLQGFQHFGPFKSRAEASRFAKHGFASNDWWTAPLLMEPEDGISEQERELANLHV